MNGSDESDEANPQPARGASPRSEVVAAIVVAGAFVSLAAWSWLRWTDVQVDFGVELYVPWRISEGDALYRDIATRNGPLSHTFNAALFAVFGPSLRVLALGNLVVLALICALTWKLFRDACGVFTATACSLVLLGMFAFAQYTGPANFNYVTPYQHAQTHALALSLVLIAALLRGLKKQSSWHWALAGACFGLVLLTKLELILPAVAVTGTGLALLAAKSRARGRSLLFFSAAAVLPPAAMTAYLAFQMPLDVAVHGVLGNFPYVGASLVRDRFYRHTMGLDALGANALAAAAAWARIVGFVLVCALANRVVPARWRDSRPAAIAIGVLVCATLLALPIDWLGFARALPLTTLTLGAAIAWRTLRAARQTEIGGRTPRELGLVLWAVLSLALLGKVALHARFGHYGFVLAMPATLLLVAGLIDLAPRLLALQFAMEPGAPVAPGSQRVSVALGAAAVAACVVYALGATATHLEAKTLEIGAGGDRILVAPEARAQLVARAIERLDALSSRDETLLVWPEGIGLNYWLRRENPSRYNLFLPSELDAFGAAEMLEDVQRNRPDWIVLLHRDGSDFGDERFGETERTGKHFVDWFRAEYTEIERIGAEPFHGQAPGLLILKRKP